jgi:hypothetical protein
MFTAITMTTSMTNRWPRAPGMSTGTATQRPSMYTGISRTCTIGIPIERAMTELVRTAVGSQSRLWPKS